MRLLVFFLSFFAIAYGLIATVLEPVAFQKVVALTDEPIPPLESQHAIDIVPLVRAIPDRGEKGSNDTVYEVLPSRRYERSVVEGLGNCSNLVKGLAWYLLQQGDTFEIVHIMPIATFLEGDGHTLLRGEFALPEGDRVGLVDVAAAAVPRTEGRVLDVGDLGHGKIPSFRLEPIRPDSEDWSRFYAPAGQSDVVIGRIRAADTARFYRFLEATYVDVGLPKRVEKILYLGLGVVLGVYPPIHVPDVAPIRSRHPGTFAVMELTLWSFRLGPLLILGCAISWLVERRAERRRMPHSALRSHSRIF